MAVVDPLNFRVIPTDPGPAITLHGCAQHLCGGRGLAGSLFDVLTVDASVLHTQVGRQVRTKLHLFTRQTIRRVRQGLAAAYLSQMLSEEGYKQQRHITLPAKNEMHSRGSTISDQVLCT